MDEIEKLIEKADELYSKGERAEAIKVYNEVLKQQPDNVQALINIGALYAGNGEHDKSKTVFSKLDSMGIPDEFLETKNNNHSLLLVNLMHKILEKVEDDEGNPIPGSEKDIKTCRTYHQQLVALNPTSELLHEQIEDLEKRIMAAEEFLSISYEEEHVGPNKQSYALNG